MNNFRIFFFSVLVPLITVALCATGELTGGGGSINRHVLISQLRSRQILNASAQTPKKGECPSLGCSGNLDILDKSRVKRSLAPAVVENGNKTLSYDHKSPLKLEIKSIRNVTRSDLHYFEETGRHAPGYMGYPPGHINEDMLVSWLIELFYKAVTSYVFIYTVKTIFWHIAKYFGLDDTYLETHITLGNEGKHPFEHYGSKGQSHKGFGPFGKLGGGTHANKQWHHPSSVWYQQPTYQYHKHGKKYELHGYDQHQAVKFAKKYAKKYSRKAHKYGLRPKPIGPYIPAYQQFKPAPKGWGW